MSSDVERRPPAADIEQAKSQSATGTREELAAAEKFLVATAEAVHPGTPASALLQYAIGYRAHLATMVAALRSLTGPQLPERY